jgi:hypothetical protein
MARIISAASYDTMFEIWADFDDSESPKEVTQLIEEHGLGIMDAFSFSAFCYGYEKAIQKMEGLSKYENEISAIDNKYGQVLFRMGLTHLGDVGIRNLTDENVEECIKQIKAKEEESLIKGRVSIMTPEFQSTVVRCAAELARFDIWELFAYIKKHISISD